MPHGTLMRSGSLSKRWAVFAPPVTESTDVDTFMTTFDRPATLQQDAQDVEPYQKLRTRWFGRDANDEDAVAQFIGYYEDGPGHLIGQATMKLGNHQPTSSFPDGMHSSVEELFDPSLTWFEVDTFTLANNDESILSAVAVADKPSFLTFDLSNALYRYILTEINVSGASPATALGAVYVPLG